MIAKIEAEIIGNFIAEKDMMFKHHPFDIDIHFETENDKYFISISKRVFDYDSFLPKVETKNGKISGIVFPSQDFIKEQIEILQHIESFGAIDKNIEKIVWQNCTIEWIPENEDEEKKLPIKKYSRNISYESDSKVLTKNWLRDCVIHKNQLSHLSLPFSFFREGSNLYRDFKYQSSFISFYLMLEGFFGNGKDYKNEKVKKEFSKSVILTKAINKTVSYLTNANNVHYNWLVKTCKKYNKKVDKEGIIHFLVEQRGNLSHFSLANSNKQKNPFREKDYHSLAYIAMMICMFSSIDLRLEPFRIDKLENQKT